MYPTIGVTLSVQLARFTLADELIGLGSSAMKDIDGTNLSLGPEVVVRGWKRESKGCLENRYRTG